jgi:hypothetical protein
VVPLGEIETKAHNSLKVVETTAKDIKEDIKRRVAEVVALLQRDAE